MAERLGNVLYWGFSGLAGLFLVFAVLIQSQSSDPNATLPFSLGVAFVAVISWLVGRACRYVLSGH